MPRIFDNIELPLLPALQDTLLLSERADFCVGYFNLRGWRQLGDLIDGWEGGYGHCCRLLVGMQRLPEEELRATLSLVSDDGHIDQQTALRLRRQMAEQFRDQLMIGAPSNADEAALRCLQDSAPGFRNTFTFPVSAPSNAPRPVKVATMADRGGYEVRAQIGTEEIASLPTEFRFAFMADESGRVQINDIVEITQPLSRPIADAAGCPTQ